MPVPTWIHNPVHEAHLGRFPNYEHEYPPVDEPPVGITRAPAFVTYLTNRDFTIRNSGYDPSTGDMTMTYETEASDWFEALAELSKISYALWGWRREEQRGNSQQPAARDLRFDVTVGGDVAWSWRIELDWLELFLEAGETWETGGVSPHASPQEEYGGRVAATIERTGGASGPSP